MTKLDSRHCCLDLRTPAHSADRPSGTEMLRCCWTRDIRSTEQTQTIERHQHRRPLVSRHAQRQRQVADQVPGDQGSDDGGCDDQVLDDQPPSSAGQPDDCCQSAEVVAHDDRVRAGEREVREHGRTDQFLDQLHLPRTEGHVDPPDAAPHDDGSLEHSGVVYLFGPGDEETVVHSGGTTVAQYASDIGRLLERS